MSFDTLLANKPQSIQQIAMQLKGLALRTDKHIQEHVYGGEKVKVALYSIGNINNVLFGLQPAEKCCILYLHFTETADTMSLKLEGDGKHARHVKISEMTEELALELKQVMKNILKASKAH